MEIKENKIPEAETRKIPRSQIKFASYNPRKIEEEANKRLNKNVKKKLYGGIVWNENTGTLVSGHRRVSICDTANKYNSETGENNYWITVSVAQMDDKEEREQNIFFNSKAAMGEFDYSKLALMIPDIDVDLAGLDSVDMSFIEIEMPSSEDIVIPSFEPQAEKKIIAEKTKDEETENPHGNPENEKAESKELSDEEKKAHVKAIKEKVKDGAVYEGEPYFTVSFDSYENKAFFLERFQIGAEARYIKGEELAEKLDEMHES